MKNLCLLITALLVFYTIDARPQSTSPWVHVEEPGTQVPDLTPSVGSTYLSANFVTGRVYQKSNWWTNFIEKNRVAVLDVTVTGVINGKNYEQVRTSKPIELRKNDSQVDVGMSPIIIDMLPTVYNPLTLKVRMSKSSQDGLESLITSLSELSASTPSLTVSQSAVGIVSGVKMLSDYLFNKNLLVEKLRSEVDFPKSGTSLKPGLYVCFAGDTASDYQGYLTKPDGGNGLVWQNSNLTWNGQNINKTSYFLIRVTYSDRIFKKATDPLTLVATKPWVALYLAAAQDVKNISASGDIAKAASQIRGHLLSGDALLDSDPDYIFDEKETIKQAIWSKVQKMQEDRVALLPADGTGKKPKPIILSTID